MKVGDLCKSRPHHSDAEELCQIVSFYDKRDIDYDCPEYVAIVPMVKAVWLTGSHQGYTFRSARRNFRRSWEVISDS